MDRETRGMISETLHWNYERSKVLETVDWALKADDQILNQEDFVLGYYIGSLMSMSVEIVARRNLFDKLPDLLKKESAEVKPKRGRPRSIAATRKEKEEIKDMLIPMIARFREKIRQEETLKKL